MTYWSIIGYPAVFIGTILEGEAVVFVSILAVKHGILSFIPTVSIIFFGALVGDMAWFMLGRYAKFNFSKKFSGVRRLSEGKIGRFAARHSDFIALSMRFAYGFRSIIPMTLGFSGVSPFRFAAWNTISVALWTAVVVNLSFFFGSAFEPYIRKLELFEKKSAVITVIALISVIIFFTVKKEIAMILNGRSEGKNNDGPRPLA